MHKAIMDIQPHLLCDVSSVEGPMSKRTNAKVSLALD